MIAKPFATFLANAIYSMDKACRLDLQTGIIVSERDYVSNLSTHIRYPFGVQLAHHLPRNMWHSITLPPSVEQKIGCDAIVVFATRNKVKIGLFEAKWPRFKSKRYKFDKKGATLSHFADQIDRQSAFLKHNKGVVIWEMFFDERTASTSAFGYDVHGSTCVLHKEAHDFEFSLARFRGARNSEAWRTADVNKLVSSSRSSMNLMSLLEKMLVCELGDAEENVGFVSLRMPSDESTDSPEPTVVTLPILGTNGFAQTNRLDTSDDSYNVAVTRQALEQLGLTSYWCINLEAFDAVAF